MQSAAISFYLLVYCITDPFGYQTFYNLELETQEQCEEANLTLEQHFTDKGYDYIGTCITRTSVVEHSETTRSSIEVQLPEPKGQRLGLAYDKEEVNHD